MSSETMTTNIYLCHDYKNIQWYTNYICIQRLSIILKNNNNGLICWNDRVLIKFSFSFILSWPCKNCFVLQIIKRWPIVSVGVKTSLPETKECREGLLEKVRFKQGPEGVESNYCLKVNVSLPYTWEAELLPWTKDTFYSIKWQRVNKAIYLQPWN